MTIGAEGFFRSGTGIARHGTSCGHTEAVLGAIVAGETALNGEGPPARGRRRAAPEPVRDRRVAGLNVPDRYRVRAISRKW